MVRGIMTAAVLSGIALGTWASFYLHGPRIPDLSEIEITLAEAEAQPAPESNSPQPPPLDVSSGENPAPDPGFPISRETLEAITCGPWSVSDIAMEAILEELIRRGWTPPTRSAALATHQSKNPAIRADSPDEPAGPVIEPEQEDLHTAKGNRRVAN